MSSPRLAVVASVFVTVLGLCCTAAMLAPRGAALADAVSVGWATTLLLSALGGALFLGHWRRSRQVTSLWLGLSTWVAGCGLSGIVVLGARLGTVRTHLELDAIVAAGTLLLLHQAARSRSVRHGISRVGIGMAIGTGVVLGQASTLTGAGSGRVDAQRAVIEVVLCLLGAACVGVLLRLHDLDARRRNILVVAGVLTVLGYIATPLDSVRPGPGAAVGVGLAVLAAAVLAVEGGVLYVASSPMLQPIRVQPANGAEREQLHEVRASMAGVASAVHLLLDVDKTLRGPGRERIEDLLRHEVSRLQRLLAGARSTDVATVELDDVLTRAVTARRLAGQEVGWQPSGLRAYATNDVVSEVVNILLVNAATHAPGAPVHVTVEKATDAVRIVVRDEGPGFDPGLRQLAFTSGVCGPSSPGEGIGLDLARRLARSVRGDLTLGQSHGGGACLVFAVPAANEEAVA